MSSVWGFRNLRCGSFFVRIPSDAAVLSLQAQTSSVICGFALKRRDVVFAEFQSSPVSSSPLNGSPMDRLHEKRRERHDGYQASASSELSSAVVASDVLCSVLLNSGFGDLTGSVYTLFRHSSGRMGGAGS